jgi:hypothetical protein
MCVQSAAHALLELLEAVIGEANLMERNASAADLASMDSSGGGAVDDGAADEDQTLVAERSAQMKMIIDRLASPAVRCNANVPFFFIYINFYCGF